MDDDARDRLAASLAAVLNAKEGPGPEVKARAFAASAVLALRGRPADADGAKELIAAGKKLVNGFAEPHLLRVAEARLALVREIDAAGGWTRTRRERRTRRRRRISRVFETLRWRRTRAATRCTRARSRCEA